MRFRVNSLLLIVAIAAPAFTYDLQPSNTSRIIKDPVHEMLSIASLQCKRAMRDNSPHLAIESWNCLPEQMNFASEYSRGDWAEKIRGKAVQGEFLDLELKYLLAGVRWPDDPIGTARSNAPIQLFAHYRQCQGWLDGDYGPCGNRFCLSHFGHLQMAHSMRSSAPWCDRGSYSSTCGIDRRNAMCAIGDWVRWLVPIGKGDVGPTNQVFDTDFAKALFDQSCDKVYRSNFTYQSLFFIDCSKSQWKSIFKFWRWGKLKCDPINSANPQAELRARAVGAILHLIQDSFARGHTLRVATSGSDTCSPRISCSKVTAFGDYVSADDVNKHGRADKTPEWDPSCFKADRAVDDPITAGAKVLAMFERGDSADDIWKYLAMSVFQYPKTELTEDQLKREKAYFGRDWECNPR